MTVLFRIHLWPERMLLLGPGFDTGLHRHHAAQLCLGLEGAVRLRQTQEQAWRGAPGFFVPPDQPHQFDAGSGAAALLYLEAESGACADALRMHGRTAPAALNGPIDLEPLRRLRLGDESALDSALCCFGIAAQEAAAVRDARIDLALRWIAEHIEQPIRLAAVASAAGLSASHFAHLFSAQVGVPLRRYVLWRRLRVALERAMAGASLTEAAHGAGFADSAHLSRTFRDNFGVTPSFLFEHRQRIVVRFEGSAQPG